MDEPTYIGERLKNARTQQGHTLDDLQQLTKIQKRYLIAIEENRLEDLPGDFFVNAFIRQYADVVGVSLEGQQAQRHESHVPSEGPTHDSKEKVLPTRSELKRSSRETKFTYSNDSKSTLPTFLLVLMFLLILGVIWYYIFYMGDDKSPVNETNAPNQQMIQTQSEKAESDTSGSESESASQQGATVTRSTEQTDTPTYSVTGFELPQALSIDVDTTGNSWVSVTTEEDISLFEGVIPGGTIQTIQLDEGMNRVYVRIGYLPSTTVKFDDATVELPADYQTNQTQTLTFNIE